MPIAHKIRPQVRDLLECLIRAGHEAYIVGGAVRDLLLGLEPKDYDIATSATPEEVRHAFGRRRSRIIGRRFRLVHVYLHNDVYEVSTFRREPTEEERRERVSDDGVMIWRDNAYGTLEQDAQRRDFTMNALYYDAVGDRGIIDIVGGIADLEARRVRALGDPAVRIEEDPVRILRALKLVGQFDCVLDESLAAVIRDKKALIRLASISRLFDELLKILGTGRSLSIFTAFRNVGFLEFFWPGLDRCWESPMGEFTRELLGKRDACLSAGKCSNSRVLSLTTAVLPHVASQLGDPDNPRGLWEYAGGLESLCRRMIQDFFRPFPVSRFFSARIRDILLLMPRFANRIRPTRLRRHPEYRESRELYLLLAQCCGRDLEEEIACWPEPPEPPKRQRPGARKKKRRRRH